VESYVAGEWVADITKLLDLDPTKYIEHEMYVLKTITQYFLYELMSFLNWHSANIDLLNISNKSITLNDCVCFLKGNPVTLNLINSYWECVMYPKDKNRWNPKALFPVMDLVSFLQQLV
jgi:hypothetical protein